MTRIKDITIEVELKGSEVVKDKLNDIEEQMDRIKEKQKLLFNDSGMDIEKLAGELSF